MRYITSLEQFAAAEAREKALVEGREEGLEAGREAGLEEGRQEGIVEGLKGGLILTLDLAYGEEGLAIAQEVEKINDIKILQSLRDGLKNRKSLAELRQLYALDN